MPEHAKAFELRVRDDQDLCIVGRIFQLDPDRRKSRRHEPAARVVSDHSRPVIGQIPVRQIRPSPVGRLHPQRVLIFHCDYVFFVFAQLSRAVRGIDQRKRRFCLPAVTCAVLTGCFSLHLQRNIVRALMDIFVLMGIEIRVQFRFSIMKLNFEFAGHAGFPGREPLVILFDIGQNPAAAELFLRHLRSLCLRRYTPRCYYKHCRCGSCHHAHCPFHHAVLFRSVFRYSFCSPVIR